MIFAETGMMSLDDLPPNRIGETMTYMPAPEALFHNLYGEGALGLPVR